jgi:class 3 adenylate cyclase
MGAEETAAFLNRHFGLLALCIDAENGTIDKYIGDAIMAFWGAPDRMDDHAARAVRAARRIAETIAADNARRARKGLRPVRVRIGIHTGPAVVGNIGTPERVNYTIVGDTVNDAQRLEALGHKLDDGADVTVLLSAVTASLAGPAAGAMEDVGAHPLAGAAHEVEVRRLA